MLHRDWISKTVIQFSNFKDVLLRATALNFISKTFQYCTNMKEKIIFFTDEVTHACKIGCVYKTVLLTTSGIYCTTYVQYLHAVELLC